MNGAPRAEAATKVIKLAIAVICGILLLPLLADGVLCGVAQKWHISEQDIMLWQEMGRWCRGLAIVEAGLMSVLALCAARYAARSVRLRNMTSVVVLAFFASWSLLYWVGLYRFSQAVSIHTLTAGLLPVPLLFGSLASQGDARFGFLASLVGVMCLVLLYSQQGLHISWCERHILSRGLLILCSVCLIAVGSIIVVVTTMTTRLRQPPGA